MKLPDLPRHVLALDKEFLRKFLSTPIRANKFTSNLREQRIKEETTARTEALFALYSIPNGWDELLQWRELALYLAGETFAGCRTIRRGRGGPRRETQERYDSKKRVLARTFYEHKESKKDLSDVAIARILLAKHPDECEAAGLCRPKSLAQAMRRMKRRIVPA
jgi:hypothetical protein